MTKVRIVYTPMHSLKGWDRNPKDHDIPGIRASLRRFGFVAPIIVDETSGRIVAGHGRLEALFQMHAAGEPPPNRVEVKDGAWYAPVLRGAAFADAKEAEGYLVGDNFLTENGGWDLDELTAILKDQPTLEGTGVDTAKLDALLAENEAAMRAREDDFDGDRPEEVEEDDPEFRHPRSDTGIVVGIYRIKIERADYDAWHEKIRAAVGFEKAAIAQEIKRRLGF